MNQSVLQGGEKREEEERGRAREREKGGRLEEERMEWAGEGGRG